MNETKISQRGARALAAVIHEIRQGWDEAGIYAALEKATEAVQCRNATQLVIAAIKAASDEKNRTPAIIPLDGEHWRGPATERPATSGPEARTCPCGRLIYPGEEWHSCRQSSELAELNLQRRNASIAERIANGTASDGEIEWDKVRRRMLGEDVDGERAAREAAGLLVEREVGCG